MVGDTVSGEGLAAAVAGVDRVLHLAGSNKGDDIGTGHLVDAAHAAGVAVVERGRVVSLMAFTVADGRIVRLDVLADLTRIDQTGAAEAVAHDHRPE